MFGTVFNKCFCVLSYMRAVIATMSHGASHLFSFSNETLVYLQYAAVTSNLPVSETAESASPALFCFKMNLRFWMLNQIDADI